MISAHLDGWNLEEIEFLFIENVGNLVCPANYDLGEDVRIALLSVTEGEDKPLKYPSMFHSSEAAVITKMDLAEACEFDRDLAVANIQSVRPGMRIFEVSAKKETGMRAWVDYIASQRAAVPVG
jgi:hydrogenase nickel incorporation protein HypB